MQLSRSLLNGTLSPDIVVPTTELFTLPEKIVQFGTGVLLRGLCDYHVDKANRENRFNGRIVVVKSTSAGDADAFTRQNNLYTICVRGISAGAVVKENIISSAISRVLSAATSWREILALGEDPAIKIVISNTTEVGLQLTKESIFQTPPASFPGKLLSFLYHRYQHFGDAEEGETVVVPTELVPSNGEKLKNIILELSNHNQLPESFLQWLNFRVAFCNSLVDRIVTKDPGDQLMESLQQELGYTDELLTMCEDYHLWAIQGDEHIRNILSFANTEDGAFVKPDIEIFKSLKLHLLNGTHTLSASLAYLCGFDTVIQAMENERFRRFVEKMMLEEILHAIPYEIDTVVKQQFGRKVLDRFSNPFLQHRWLNITLQNTTKMRMRNLPVLAEYARRGLAVPENMATGFAAYIFFMKGVEKNGGHVFGMRGNERYRIDDDHADFFYNLWSRTTDPHAIVSTVLSDRQLWGTDLSSFTSFSQAVAAKLETMMEGGVVQIIESK